MKTNGTKSVAPPSTQRSEVVAVARGGWWGVAGSVTNAVSAFIYVGLVTRAVGAHGAGTIFAGIAFFTILSNVCKLGADTGLVRFLPSDLAVNNGRSVVGLLRMSLVPSSIAAIAVGGPLLLFPEIATAFLPNAPGAQSLTLVRLFAIALPAATFSLLLLGATQGYGTVVPFVGIEQIGKPVLRIVIALPVAYLLPGELPLTMAWLVPSLFGPAASWIALRHCRSRYRERRTSFDACLAAPSWRDFWSFATPRAFSSIFDISATWVGVLLLSALSTVPEAGIFTAVGRVITAGALLQLAVRLSVAPLISRMLALQELADARDLHRISTCWVVLFSWPVYTLIACFPRSVLSVFGQDFVTGASALQVLCLASIINVAIGNSQTVLLMAGKSSWHLLVTAVSFSIQIVFGIFAVHAWGILGAALSWGSAIIVENFAAALIIKYTLGFKILDRSHAYALIISLIITPMLLIAHVLIGDSLAALGIGSIAAIVVFTSLTWRYSGPLAINGLIGVLRSRTRR